MAGKTASQINTIVDEILTLLNANQEALGNVRGWEERDEEPATPAYDGKLPWGYIVPIMEGGDSIDLTMDPTASYHNFSITLVAYYEMEDIANALRPVRDFAYEAFDILREHNFGIIAGGGMVHADVDVGYWVAVDAIVHFWILKCDFKALLY